MLAYKGFHPGLICLGYQFSMGKNTTKEANCAQNGFHTAENPLDCISYYPNMNRSEYCLVDVNGDRDEDGVDSKISCTELTILKKLSREEFFLHALAYMVDHPKQDWNRHVSKDWAQASGGFAVVRGVNPIARGELGDILAFAKEDPDTGTIRQVALTKVDGKEILPGRWYDVDLKEVADEKKGIA